ncbi:MAG: hypothetical protein A4E28_02925 [Methanocella sp. PtaU1.Bin125]|nr:MAG: hypothetical protein A4E28_02925 [Methanocella sp. PtaU1.Bin125]
MVGWLNLLSGAGMIAVGAIAIYLWRRRAGIEYFLFGALFWIAAIAIKIAMDLTVSAPFRELLPHTLIGALIIGLYYGLRTGLFESGIPYLSARLARMRLTFDRAVAVGIGFGAAESILLGFQSMANVLFFIMVPGIISSYPQATQDALQMQLSLAFIPVPVWERLFTTISHVFVTALALYAIRAGWKWLALSMAIGLMLDGSIFWVAYFIPSASLAYTVVLEAFVGVIGAASLYGLFWLKKRYDSHVLEA